jgi:hypothetical protein
MANTIEKWIDAEFQSDIVYKRRPNEDSPTFYHASFASMVFGFVDDMYIGKLPYNLNSPSYGKDSFL